MWPFHKQSASAPKKINLGARGEHLAKRWLRKRGFKILATNYRCPSGEADLIALDRSTLKETGSETIVIVEVKTRSNDSHTAPQSAVDADKRRRLQKIANYYLATHDAADFNLRFDIIAVVVPPGGKAEVTHIPGAF